MSREENGKMISAYQKMLNDGTAFKEVDMSMMSNPSVGEAQSGGDFSSMGEREERVTETEERRPDRNPDIPERDYSQYDSIMEGRIASLRDKMESGGVKKTGKRISGGLAREVATLKKKVAQLEEALMLVMETHENLIG